ncbi:hypothetical protein ACFX10_032820 [Malus domestica]
MNSNGKPQGLHLRPHKGTYLGSFYLSDSGPTKAHFKVNFVLLFQPCPTSLARRVLPDKDLPDETYPTKPDSEAEARQQPSTGANLPRSCVLVVQEASPTEIPDANIVLARPVGYILLDLACPKRKAIYLAKNPKEGLLQMADQSENPSSPSGQVVLESPTASER